MSDQPSSSVQPGTATVPAPPPPVKPPVSLADTSPAPRGKRRGCVMAAVIALIVLLTIAGVGFAVVSASGKPKDLGVRYTEADYWSAVNKAGVKGIGAAAKGFSGDVRYSGKKKIDVVFTPAEVSALLNYSHKPGWPISDTQVRFNGSDGVEVSALVEVGGTKYPVYARGTAAITGGVVSGQATSAQFLGVAVPSQYLEPGSEYLVGIVNSRLSRLGSLDIKTAEVVDGGLHLVGTAPATAEPAK